MNDEITVEEWRAEIDSLRNADLRGQTTAYTEEQMRVLMYARGGQYPVTWKRLSRFWASKNWAGFSVRALQGAYRRSAKQGLVDVENMR